MLKSTDISGQGNARLSAAGTPLCTDYRLKGVVQLSRSAEVKAGRKGLLLLRITLLVIAAAVTVGPMVRSGYAGLQSGHDPAAQSAPSQQHKPDPMTENELLVLIKHSGPGKISQSDIAAEVSRRGIGFQLSDQIIAELRNAGAETFLIESIKHSTVDAGLPHLQVRTKDSDSSSAPPAGDSAGRPTVNRSDEGEVSPEEIDKANAEALSRLPFIEQARYHALQFTTELPNFIVDEGVSRYVRTPQSGGEWKLEDNLEISLTYVADKGEQFKLLKINGRPTHMSYDSLNGSTSSGEFGATLGSLFAPQSKAQFRELRHETFRGHDSIVYDFAVRKENSSLQVTDKDSGQSRIAGYTGTVWIDSETKRVLRIEESADEAPFMFPITLSESAVEYDFVTISGTKFFLPVHAEVLLGRDNLRYYSKNVIEFTNYHKFEGDIKVLPDSN